VDPGAGSEGRVAARALGLPLFCVVVAALKLWLVAGDEVVARANPLDQVRYLEMARELSSGRWLGDYGLLTLIREPGYPAWVAAVDRLGVPLRLANEWLLLGASGLFCAALAASGVSAGVVGAAYVLLVLEPNSLLVNRDALPSSFYLPMVLVGMAALVLAASVRRYRSMLAWAAAAGLPFGVLWLTRPEKPLLLVPVGAFVAWDGLAGLRLGETWRPALARVAALLLAPLAVGAAIVGAVALANHHHYGVFAATDVAGPGYLAANRALLSIEQRAPQRFVPVPRDVRERAYAVSPAFRELREKLEGPSWARGVSCRIDRVCDDIGAGYFRWLLREAAAAAGHFGSAADSERYFGRVAVELEAACRSGALRCTRSPTSFLHPVPATWAPHLGESFRRVRHTAFTSGDPRIWDAALDSPSEPPPVRRLFDAVANRRVHRTGNGRVRIRGRAAAAEDPVVRVALQTNRGRVDSAIDEVVALPGAPGERGVAFAFDLEKRTRDFGLYAAALEIERASGASRRIPLRRAPGEPFVHDGVRVEIDTWEETRREDRRRRIARTALWLAHPPIYAALSVAGLLAAIALLPARRRDRFCDPAVAVIAMLLAWVFARTALLVLVDASSFPARSSRYVYPALAPYGCALLLLVEQGLRNLRGAGPGGRARGSERKRR
jgi:hypothetical protein